MARTQLVDVLLDAISFARKEDDLVKEQLLYSRMMDVMRDPDVVEKVSGKTLRARENSIFNRFGKDAALQ